MNFIKKIFDGKADEQVHLQFQKFSKGEFRNKALIKAKRTGNKYTISTSAEFGNELVRVVAEKIGSEKVKVTGAVVSTNDLKDKLEIKDVKQFQGVKRYIIDNEMSGDEILGLLDEFPKIFFALSFSTPDKENVLKIKPKAPKSGKPGKKGDKKPKVDFCKLVTTNKKIAESFVWEKDNFKIAEINHTFLIDGIIIPEELKSSEDFKKIREESKRKGKIVREANIDGQVVKEEKEFEA